MSIAQDSKVQTKSFNTDGFHLTVYATCEDASELKKFVENYLRNFHPCGYGTTARYVNENTVEINRALCCD